MKKVSLILALVIAMFFSLSVQAKQAPDYYAGKWDVLVKGTPNGDVHFLFAGIIIRSLFSLNT